MSEKSGGTGTWMIILLLGICSWVLIDIYQEMKLQRTPEQIEALAKQDAAEAQAEAYLKEQREKRESELKQKSWKEVGFSEEGLEKFIAHGYFFWIFGFALILSGPMLMAKFRNY